MTLQKVFRQEGHFAKLAFRQPSRITLWAHYARELVSGKPLQPISMQHSSLLGHMFVMKKMKCCEYDTLQ
jgi:hypothetical protein